MAEQPVMPEGPSRTKRARNRALRSVFEAGQRLKVDILPRHFYSSIPDVRALARDEAWRAPRSMAGIAGADLDAQLQVAASICTDDLRQEVSRRDVHGSACARNGATGFGAIEADFLFCFVAERRPARIVQVGAGVSTAVCLAAADHAGYRPEIVCVDPFPTDFLVSLDAAGDIRLHREPAQTVPLEVLTGAGDGGLLFVDSTHTVGPGSEVNRLILEVVPRLEPGTWVHFHDIFFPYDYSRGVLDEDLFFWNETALLYALLVGNASLRIAVSLSMLHYGRPDRLAELLPRYVPQANRDGLHPEPDAPGHFPSSAYLLT